ncbi:hypothetical protein HanXRQr2_Chr04g0182561 [Helianthus annuus]|uniref:Uncharacterized protein n=1 Tax=Helianthus annuus TaxID=4232 RepID=A0A9K3J9X8_HELAN|nr:hypothetical protein HanXRQr2_Chr04g0182561 [Helianthus annuus]
MTRVGVLVGEVNRINEVVAIKWKNRVYRVWGEEESDIWVLDCLGPALVRGSVGSSPVMSSQFGAMPNSGMGGNGQSPVEDEDVGIDETPLVGSGNSHAVVTPMHEERESEVGNNDEGGEGASRKLEGFSVVGPKVRCSEDGATRNCFFFSSSSKSGQAHQRKLVGPRFRRAPAHAIPNISPENTRPKKRSRGDAEVSEPGFEFVGFTSRISQDVEGCPSTIVGGFDLNLRATPVESQSFREEDPPGAGANGVEVEVDSEGIRRG